MRRKYRDLDEFFEKTGHTQQWLAAQLDIDTSHVSLIKNRKRQPSLELALRIEELTGVPVQSFARDDSAEVPA